MSLTLNLDPTVTFTFAKDRSVPLDVFELDEWRTGLYASDAAVEEEVDDPDAEGGKRKTRVIKSWDTVLQRLTQWVKENADGFELRKSEAKAIWMNLSRALAAKKNSWQEAPDTEGSPTSATASDPRYSD